MTKGQLHHAELQLLKQQELAMQAAMSLFPSIFPDVKNPFEPHDEHAWERMTADLTIADIQSNYLPF